MRRDGLIRSFARWPSVRVMMHGNRGFTMALLAATALGLSANTTALATALVRGSTPRGFEGQQGPPARAVPGDAITTILDAFRSHSVVALGEGPHGNQQGHVFRLSLVRDPRFAMLVNDIMVEFGSGRYQDVMDRFVRGEDVPYDTLRRVWQDTTVPTAVWDRPIYEEFFRAIRLRNGSLPPARRLRVLLGDAPIDWDGVKGPEDVRQWGMRKDPYAGASVKREVLAKGRRVLIIYGDGHLQGRGFAPASLINVLERPPQATKVFNIASSSAPLKRLQPDVEGWRVPSVVRVRATVLGAAPYASFYPLPPAEGWNAVRMEDQFDAILYLGPSIGAAGPQIPPALCRDPAYVKMRLRRLELNGGFLGKAGIETLKALCPIEDAP